MRCYYNQSLIVDHPTSPWLRGPMDDAIDNVAVSVSDYGCQHFSQLNR
jgi:hypothetical protein